MQTLININIIITHQMKTQKLPIDVLTSTHIL